MPQIRCPQCGADDVEVHLEADAKGQLLADGTYGKCRKCGRKLSAAELKAALGQ